MQYRTIPYNARQYDNMKGQCDEVDYHHTNTNFNNKTYTYRTHAWQEHLQCGFSDLMFMIMFTFVQALLQKSLIFVNPKLPKNGGQKPFVLPRGPGVLMRGMVIVPTKSYFNPNQNGSNEGRFLQIACQRMVPAYGGDIVMRRLPSISPPG